MAKGPIHAKAQEIKQNIKGEERDQTFSVARNSTQKIIQICVFPSKARKQNLMHLSLIRVPVCHDNNTAPMSFENKRDVPFGPGRFVSLWVHKY